MRDELKQPLHKRSLSQRLWQARPTALVTAYALVLTSFACGGAWLLRQPMPYAGEPIVSLQIPAIEIIDRAKIEPMPEAGPAADLAEVDTAAVDQASEPPKITKLDQHVMVISSPRRALEKAPIEAVTEAGAQGPLPKIADSGKRPSEAYARPVAMNTLYGDTPKVVIVLGGMGLNEKLTKRASTELPANVTFAFAPYGNNLQDQVDRVREGGHEVLLQLPLEPVGYPATNPGPKTLLADASPADNQDNLFWHMSRFAGYAGVINYMGGRFLSAPTAIKPLLTELKKRGLTFMEDGSLPLSATDQVASHLNISIRHGQGVIDANPDAESIKAALTALEDQAKNGGVAIGTGSGLEVTINAVKEWAKDAEERGIVIVPASAAFKGKSG